MAARSESYIANLIFKWIEQRPTIPTGIALTLEKMGKATEFLSDKLGVTQGKLIDVFVKLAPGIEKGGDMLRYLRDEAQGTVIAAEELGKAKYWDWAPKVADELEGIPLGKFTAAFKELQEASGAATPDELMFAVKEYVDLITASKGEIEKYWQLATFRGTRMPQLAGLDLKKDAEGMKLAQEEMKTLSIAYNSLANAEATAKQSQAGLREDFLKTMVVLTDGRKLIADRRKGVTDFTKALIKEGDALSENTTLKGMALRQEMSASKFDVSVRAEYDRLTRTKKKGGKEDDKKLAFNRAYISSQMKTNAEIKEATALTLSLYKSMLRSGDVERKWQNRATAKIRKLVGIEDAQKLLTGAVGEYDKQQKQLAKREKEQDKRLDRSLMKWSWFGFRLQSVGRMMMRWVLAPIGKAIKVLSQWDKTLEHVAVSMGLLAATGAMDPMRRMNLEDFLGDIPKAGLEFQAAFNYLQSSVMNFLFRAGYPLKDLLLTLGDAIFSINMKPMINAMAGITNTITMALPLLMKFAREFLVSFARGIQSGVVLLTTMLSVLSPFLGILGRFTGILAGLSPLMMGLGLAIFFAAPGMMLLRAVTTAYTQTLPGLIGSVKVTIGVLRGLSFAQMKTAMTTQIMATKMLGVITVFSLVGLLLAGLIKKNKDLTKGMTNSIRDMSNEMKLATFDMASNIVAGTIETQFAITDLGEVINQTSGEVIGSWDAAKNAVVDANGDIVFSFNEADGTILDATGNIVGYFKTLGDDFTTEADNVVGSINTSTGAISGFFGDMKVILRSDGTIINTETGKIVGYFDSLTGTITNFETDATASVENAGTSIATALSGLTDSINEMDFSVATDSIDDFSTNLQESMDANMRHLLAFNAIMIGAQFGLPGLIVGLGAAAVLEVNEWMPAILDMFESLGSGAEDSGGLTKDAMDEIIESMDDFTEAYEDWKLQLEDPDGPLNNSIGEDFQRNMQQIVDSIGPAVTAIGEINSAMGGMGGMDGGLGGAGVQHITIHSTIMIENVSGIADLEMVEDASNRGISEAMRRRNWA